MTSDDAVGVPPTPSGAPLEATVGVPLPQLVDVSASAPVSGNIPQYAGMKWHVVTESVELPSGDHVRRDVVQHPGAVGVVALRGDAGREQVLLLQQYRHPVRARLWELPAGLLDEPGEPALTAAQRELGEEAGVAADTWHTLIDVFSSPGMSNEAYRIYLAQDVTLLPPEVAHQRTEEEADLVVGWFDLSEAVQQVVNNQIHNAMAVVGLFAAVTAREANWTSLRPADDAWSSRPQWPLSQPFV